LKQLNGENLYDQGNKAFTGVKAILYFILTLVAHSVICQILCELKWLFWVTGLCN